MKPISPDHPIAITLHPRGVRVMFAGEVLAQTRRALALTEASYPPVIYIPRADVRLQLFRKTSNATHCPYKGDASYYSALTAVKISENAAWSYETPFEQMAEIRDHFAFYPTRVDAIEEFA